MISVKKVADVIAGRKSRVTYLRSAETIGLTSSDTPVLSTEITGSISWETIS